MQIRDILEVVGFAAIQEENESIGDLMKRVLSIQDISCIGKCSQTIALPIISALGSEAVILPTALLSSHTIFPGFTFKDLSDQIGPITRHWKEQDIRFDAIYSGYLGSIGQIDMVKEIWSMFREDDTLVIVDPVMADHGVLYKGFDMDYVRKNTELCAGADIIVPNITEACLMTGTEFREEHDEAYVRELLAKTTELGARITVLTGVSLEQGMTGVIGYDRAEDETFIYQNRKIDATFHGTGDLFSSTVVGELMKGKSWKDAFRIASDYTAYTIEVTMRDPHKPWYGVDFETTIPYLINAE